MRTGEKLNFTIDHLDPLGQGVHKDERGVVFIPKTLPGEKGIASINKSSRGVHFAQALELEQASPDRIPPECPHYTECPGCQYLHAPYKLEMDTKKEALKRLFRPLLNELNVSIHTHDAPMRWSYRNRMQLHYDLRLKKLGVRTPKGILAIPNCLMPNSDLKDAYTRLQQAWQTLVSNEPKEGHIEIYAKEGMIHTSVNQPYSDGGFTQVFAEMNDLALEQIHHFTRNQNIQTAIDLFGGAGNLSAHLDEAKVYVIDGVKPEQKLKNHQSFVVQNIYAKDALKRLQKEITEPIDLVLIDPPRSGYIGIKEFLSYFKPKSLVYMSCFTPTMVRDLKEIVPLIESIDIHLLDFFPSTQHFETLALIKLK